MIGLASPVNGQATDQPVDLTADLDGKPIELVEVGKWYCHDFDHPAIHCFADPSDVLGNGVPGDDVLGSSDVAQLAAGTTYVTVYDFTTFQGGFMHMSQNYSILALIGWSDRISSFQVVNGMSGAFWTDWLYSGTRYNFCCNQGVGSLGGFNDSFSSVFHN